MGGRYLLDRLPMIVVPVIKNDESPIGMGARIQNIVKGLNLIIAVALVSRTAQLRILKAGLS